MNGENDSGLTEFIRTLMVGLCEATGRKYSDGLGAAAVSHLRGFPRSVLARAFRRAETEYERGNILKHLREKCNEESPSTAWKYEYRHAVGRDNETGKLVDIYVDPVTNEEMFRAEDCKEGRAFLKKLHEYAGRQMMPRDQTDTELEIERQKQQLALAQLGEKKGL